MRSVLDPFQFVVIAIAGWMNQRQQQVIEYLLEFQYPGLFQIQVPSIEALQLTPQPVK